VEPLTLDRRLSREVDRRAVDDYGIPSLLLMENAGRGVADLLLRLGISGPVAVCCGKGNNGGDGFVIARHLDGQGVDVRVLLWSEPDELTGDAAQNFQILARCGLKIEVFGTKADPARLGREISGTAWIVDALLGTGARGNPRPPLDAVIEELNRHPAPKLAVDVPSGLDCDTGRPAAHTIRAAHTCTFVTAKPGFLLPAAQTFVGQLHVLPIGTPRKLLAEIASAAG
jgi:NAD(P)H-hydrate epimerase